MNIISMTIMIICGWNQNLIKWNGNGVFERSPRSVRRWLICLLNKFIRMKSTVRRSQQSHIV